MSFSHICEAVGSWDTSKVTTMESMFYGARSFNQSLDKWNTSSVVDMSFVFHNAVAFNQASGFFGLARGTGSTDARVQETRIHEFMEQTEGTLP